MSAIGFILLLIFGWFFYNLLVKVVLPVYRTTRQIRRQFRDMSNQRESHSSADNQTAPPKENATEKVGEYIDFEEVK
ncbi:hypothetical protein ABDK00_017265 [Niabella insulamsoli]|uniref:hypothetical protein n=1 Tax=Niabella insulamsoli TaxID=3144874 RepID=UPI0031FCE36F